MTKDEQAAQLRASGLKYREIGEAMGCSESRAYYLANKAATAEYYQLAKAHIAERYQAKKAERQAYQRAYTAANREALGAKARAKYQEVHAERIAARALAKAQYVPPTPEEKRLLEQARQRAYRTKNRAGILLKQSIKNYGPEWGPVHRVAMELEYTLLGGATTKGDRAQQLRDSGMTWREVGAAMGTTEKNAFNNARNWRNRIIESVCGD
jgi:hypothetical protein